MAREEFLVELVGGREFRRELRRLGDDWPKKLKQVNYETADIVARQAAINAPVRTGRLKRSIKARKQQAAAAVSAGTPTRVPYAPVIEFGWAARGIEPQPYMYPAIRQTEDEFMRLYERRMEELAARAFPD